MQENLRASMIQTESKGLILVTIGANFAVLANTLAKLQDHVPLLQLMQARFAIQLLFTLCLVVLLALIGVPINSGHGKRSLLITRAVTFAIATGALWTSLRFLPVGECTAIIFVHPILTGVQARIWLDEELDHLFTLQAMMSFLGVVLIVEPWRKPLVQDHGVLGVGLALLACVGFSTTNILTRSMLLRNGPSQLTIQLYQDSLSALVFLPCAQMFIHESHDSPGGWSTWTRKDVLVLVAFTFAGLATSLFFISGFAMSKAHKASLLMYIEVPAAYLVQNVFFHEPARVVRIIGALLITLSATLRLLFEMSIKSKKFDGTRDEEVEEAGETDPLLDFEQQEQPSSATMLSVITESSVDLEDSLDTGSFTHFATPLGQMRLTPRSPRKQQGDQQQIRQSTV
mmetsp:Transcript_90040/g.160318  ORF Transcript_90040/g.160318 Transcript_90040/m.160318 type:complete len:400 (+) Transcript_90040:78-1277(+)